MTDDELRDLQERVSLIQSMTETQGWALLLDAARATVLNKQTRLLQGRADSHKEYKTECAFIEGMDYLVKLPDKLQLRLDQELELREEARVEEEELEEVV